MFSVLLHTLVMYVCVVQSSSLVLPAESCLFHTVVESWCLVSMEVSVMVKKMERRRREDESYDYSRTS